MTGGLDFYRPNPRVAGSAPGFYPFMDVLLERHGAAVAEAVRAAVERRAERPGPVPRRVWLHWAQGWAAAPPVALLCRDSWLAWNRRYDVVPTDEAGLADLLAGVAWEPARFPPRIRADALRLRLLARRGGVWADATVFCSRPLETWLPFCTADSRFFVFAFRPGGDRGLASWFIQGDGGSPLLAAWSALFDLYLAELSRRRQAPHAYFALHYVFDIARQLLPETRDEWETMPKLPPAQAGGAVLRMLEAGDDAGLGEAEQARLARLLHEIPLHKLSWKGAVAAGGARVEAVFAALRACLAAGRA
ncbi:MAG: capsular polysaccharide synthesis protein [Acetobacteraceae bacterium]